MGQEFAHFFEVAKDLAATSGTDLQFKMPCFFSETRFPNYASVVLYGFKENYYPAPRAKNLKEWNDLHKLVAKKTKKAIYRDTG